MGRWTSKEMKQEDFAMVQAGMMGAEIERKGRV